MSASLREAPDDRSDRPGPSQHALLAWVQKVAELTTPTRVVPVNYTLPPEAPAQTLSRIMDVVGASQLSTKPACWAGTSEKGARCGLMTWKIVHRHLPLSRGETR